VTQSFLYTVMARRAILAGVVALVMTGCAGVAVACPSCSTSRPDPMIRDHRPMASGDRTLSLTLVSTLLPLALGGVLLREVFRPVNEDPARDNR
jgi:hypothetical protein